MLKPIRVRQTENPIFWVLQSLLCAALPEVFEWHDSPDHA
jgi:hypothetical protein